MLKMASSQNLGL